MVKKIQMKNCPECGSTKLKNTMEGIICGKCGMVLNQNFFSGFKVV